MKKKHIVIAIIALILLLGASIFASTTIETFSSVEPRAVIVILVNCLLYIGMGIILYRLIKKTEKDTS